MSLPLEHFLRFDIPRNVCYNLLWSVSHNFLPLHKSQTQHTISSAQRRPAYISGRNFTLWRIIQLHYLASSGSNRMSGQSSFLRRPWLPLPFHRDFSFICLKLNLILPTANKEALHVSSKVETFDNTGCDRCSAGVDRLCGPRRTTGSPCGSTGRRSRPTRRSASRTVRPCSP